MVKTWAKILVLCAALTAASASLTSGADVSTRASSPQAETAREPSITTGSRSATLRRSGMMRSASPPEISTARSLLPQETLTLDSYPSPAYAKNQNWRFDLKSVVTIQHQQHRATRQCPTCERFDSVELDFGSVHLRSNEHTVSV